MTRRTSPRLHGTALVVLTLTAGCRDTPQEVVLNDLWCVTSVELTPRSVSLAPRDSAKLTAEIHAAIPACGFSNDHRLAWSVSDSSVAVIRPARDSTVWVTGLAPGSAILYVRLQAFESIAASEVLVTSN